MTRLIAIALVMWMPAIAAADAIGIPDTPCPPGSARMVAGHGGTWCGPVPCGAGETCAGACREAALCTGPGTHYIDHGHLATSPPPTPAEHVEAFGTCGLLGGCDRGTCTTEMRCVAEDAPLRAEPITPPPAPSSAAPTTSSGCHVGATGSSLVISALALAALGIGVRRRLRR